MSEGAPRSPGQDLPPPVGSPGWLTLPLTSDLRTQTGYLPNSLPVHTGCQPGPGHPPAAQLCPHPPSQGRCPARRHPAGPEPCPRAGGCLPGLLHTPGQVPGPTSLTTPAHPEPPPTPSPKGAPRTCSNCSLRAHLLRWGGSARLSSSAFCANTPAQLQPRCLRGEGPSQLPHPTPEPTSFLLFPGPSSCSPEATTALRVGPAFSHSLQTRV